MLSLIYHRRNFFLQRAKTLKSLLQFMKCHNGTWEPTVSQGVICTCWINVVAFTLIYVAVGFYACVHAYVWVSVHLEATGPQCAFLPIAFHYSFWNRVTQWTWSSLTWWLVSIFLALGITSTQWHAQPFT